MTTTHMHGVDPCAYCAAGDVAVKQTVPRLERQLAERDAALTIANTTQANLRDVIRQRDAEVKALRLCLTVFYEDKDQVQDLDVTNWEPGTRAAVTEYSKIWQQHMETVRRLLTPAGREYP